MYAGYAPLSVRALHWMSQPEWAGREETLQTLPGPLSSHDISAPAEPPPPTAGEAEGGGADGGGGVTLVFFIGGVTFSEISAIRWLRRNAKPRRQYMVATTHIASGEQMIGSLLRPFENNLTYLDR